MGRKASYTDRPLTAEEREFAKNHHNLIFTYCHKNKLPLEDWYDILVIPYLQSAKKYMETEKLHNYSFMAILFQDLHRAYGNYYRDLNRQCRMPEGGFTSLDLKIDDSKKEDEYIGEWWIDRKQDVEQEIIDKAMLLDIMENLNEIQQKILNMLLQDYLRQDIKKNLGIGQRTFRSNMEEIERVVRNYFM